MQSPPADPTETTRALRILVVEDDGLIGMLLAEMLNEMGHDVCAIEATEADAVAAVFRCRPDLMIVDASLREGSGFAVVDIVRRNGPIPHLFATGNISQVTMLRPDAVVIQKPYDEAQLASAIERAIHGRPAPARSRPAVVAAAPPVGGGGLGGS